MICKGNCQYIPLTVLSYKLMLFVPKKKKKKKKKEKN